LVPVHAVPHALQLFRSLSVSTHEPPQQVCPALQTLPHEPQLFSSVVVSKHAEPQQSDAGVVPPIVQSIVHEPHVVALLASSTQWPLQHAVPVPHTVPHAPQLSGSVATWNVSSIVMSQSLSRPSHASAVMPRATHWRLPPRQSMKPSAQSPV
jgi:hypothetical protein